MEDFFAQDETQSKVPVNYWVILVVVVSFKLMKKETLNIDDEDFVFVIKGASMNDLTKFLKDIPEENH